MSDLNNLVLKQTNKERSNDLDTCRWSSPLNYVDHLTIILAVEISVERLCAVRNDESLTEGIKARHRYLLEVNNSNAMLSFLVLYIGLTRRDTVLSYSLSLCCRFGLIECGQSLNSVQLPHIEASHLLAAPAQTNLESNVLCLT